MILNAVDNDIGKWLLFFMNIWDDEEYTGYID
jgi:hypothetical protein